MNNSRQSLGDKIKKKFRQLVVPAIIFGGIYILYSSGDVACCLNDRFKYGYWFTLTLFEFFLLQYAVDGIWSITKKGCHIPSFVLLNIVMVIFVYGMSLPSVEHKIQGMPALNWLGLPQWRYYMYFVMGRLLQLHIERIAQWKYRDVSVVIIIAVFFILSVLQWGLHWTAKGAFFHLTLILFETCALLSVFALFYKHRDKFGEKSVLALRWLPFIGKRTLDIYMLHYFFLPKDMTIVGEYFSKHSDMVGEMIVSGVMALAVIAVSLVVGEMIRVSKIFSYWVLGTQYVSKRE